MQWRHDTTLYGCALDEYRPRRRTALLVAAPCDGRTEGQMIVGAYAGRRATDITADARPCRVPSLDVLEFGVT
jgi:hypothetical protein